MRSTLHLVLVADRLAIHPLTLPVLAKTFRSPFAPGLNGADLDEVVTAGVALLTEAPRTRAQLSDLLAPRWPEAEPATLAYAATNAPLVQTTPRGLWRRTGQATWAPAVVARGPARPRPSVDALVLRYLAAFGPASVADIRTWSGITGLREVVKLVPRPQLGSFRTRAARSCSTCRMAPSPIRTPPRRSEYDNLLLSHADRWRCCGLGPDAVPDRQVDRAAALRRLLPRLLGDPGTTGYATVDRFTPAPSDAPNATGEIRAEAALPEFVAPDASERRVRFFEPSV